MKKALLTSLAICVFSTGHAFAAGSWASFAPIHTEIGSTGIYTATIGYQATFTADSSDGSVPDLTASVVPSDTSVNELGTMSFIVTECGITPGGTTPTDGTTVTWYNKFGAPIGSAAASTSTTSSGTCSLSSYFILGPTDYAVITVNAVHSAIGTVWFKGMRID